MTLTARTKQYFILALLSALTACAATGYVLVQLYEQGAALEASLTTVVESTAKANAITRIENLTEETVDDRAALAQAFFSSSLDGTLYITELEALAPTLGLSFENDLIDVVSAAAGGKSEVVMRFSFSGSKERVLEFSRLLENLPYHSRLESLQLSGDGALWKAEAAVKITVFSS